MGGVNDSHPSGSQKSNSALGGVGPGWGVGGRQTPAPFPGRAPGFPGEVGPGVGGGVQGPGPAQRAGLGLGATLPRRGQSGIWGAPGPSFPAHGFLQQPPKPSGSRPPPAPNRAGPPGGGDGSSPASGGAVSAAWPGAWGGAGWPLSARGRPAAELLGARYPTPAHVKSRDPLLLGSGTQIHHTPKPASSRGVEAAGAQSDPPATVGSQTLGMERGVEADLS